jgi:hypothetical protein
VAESLTIGLIGPPGAGKTRLLLTLIEAWNRAGRLGKPTSALREFLSQGTRPTESATHQTLNVEHGTGRIAGRITFLDGPGETLTEAVEALPEGSREARPVLTLLDRCELLFFVVDPAIAADSDARAAALERSYHTAAGLMRSLLARRGNRYLPVMFVLTHHDRWASDPSLRAAAEAWSERVNRLVRAVYREALTGHYPSDLVDPDLTTAAVNVTAPEQAEALLERAVRLVRTVRAFDPVPLPVRLLVRSTLLVTLVTFLLLALWLASGKARQATEAPSLEVLLDQAPNTQLHDARTAAAINAALRREPHADAERALRLKAESVASQPTDEGVARLGTYLAELPPRDGDLSAAQHAYWQALRRYARSRSADLAAPPASERVAALASELEKLRAQAEQATVAATDEDDRPTLLADLEQATAFLRQVARTSGLTARLQIRGGQVPNTGGDRRLTYRSGGREFPALRLRTIKMGERLSLTPAGEPVEVVVAIGDPGTLLLERRNAANTGWEKEAEWSLAPGPTPWTGPGRWQTSQAGIELQGEITPVTAPPVWLTTAAS